VGVFAIEGRKVLKLILPKRDVAKEGKKPGTR